jgi:hypothetical protein
MSGKRLFAGLRSEGQHLLLDVEQMILPRHSVGLCGLGVCVHAALQSAGLTVAYSRLMGLLNAAFMLQVDEDFSLAAAVDGRWTRLDQTLAELGFGAARLLDAPVADNFVEAELTAGRAVCAFGWGDAVADWSLICGLSDDGLEWWGYEFCSEPVLVSATAECRMLLAIGEMSGEPNFAGAEHGAIVAAGQLSASPTGPVAAYLEWAELMRRDRPFPDGPAGDEMIGRHEWLTHVLLDARAAAVAFLEDVADRAEPPVAADLLQAADFYRRSLESLEARQPHLYDPMIAAAMRDGDVRADWAELLETAAGLETEALRLLGRSARGGALDYWQEEA